MIRKLLTLSFLFASMLSFGQQWEARANTPFTKDHGIGFSLGGFGYVLTGGANGQVFSATRDFFKYDPQADTWEQLPDYPGPVRGYGIGDVWNGKLYFGFGVDNFSLLNDLWEWDPVTNVFTELASCPCQGRVHPAFVAADGKIYMGTGGASGNLQDWWEYDIATDQWQQRTNIPQPRHHPYQFAIGGDVYVGNGHRSSWYRFDAANNSWTAVASLATRVAGAQFSYGGKGYALSGTDNNHNRFSTGEFWEYDPASNDWTALTPHPGVSRFAPTQFVIDNFIYIAGGYERNDPTNTLIGLNTTWRYQLGPSSVSVDETEAETTSLIYPNPATNEINIQLSQELSQNALINVYGLNGQLVLTRPFEQQLDITNLTKGMYIMDIVDEGVSILKEKITKL